MTNQFVYNVYAWQMILPLRMLIHHWEWLFNKLYTLIMYAYHLRIKLSMKKKAYEKETEDILKMLKVKCIWE